tara:strand:- start:37289 stop:37474 length:186 start_codon:yes stop_codon:yes gene_type:complete
MPDQKEFTMASVRRVARQIVDLPRKKRGEILQTFPSEMKCRLVEEMINIINERIKTDEASN